MAFTAFVLFMGVGVGRLWRYSICSVYGALALYVFFSLGSRLAFVCFFMLSIGGCLQVWCIRAQASPSHEPLPPSLAFSSEVPSAWRGGSWLEGAGLPATGA